MIELTYREIKQIEELTEYKLIETIMRSNQESIYIFSLPHNKIFTLEIILSWGAWDWKKEQWKDMHISIKEITKDSIRLEWLIAITKILKKKNDCYEYNKLENLGNELKE